MAACGERPRVVVADDAHLNSGAAPSGTRATGRSRPSSPSAKAAWAGGTQRNCTSGGGTPIVRRSRRGSLEHQREAVSALNDGGPSWSVIKIFLEVCHFGVARAFFVRLAASGAGARGPKGTLRRAALLRASRGGAYRFFLMSLEPATLPFFPSPKARTQLYEKTHKKSYASRLAPRSPSSGANDDESPEPS